MTTPASPLFIVVEGLDGVGKSTIVKRLAEALEVIALRTPQTELLPVRADILRCFADAPLATTLFYASTVAAASQQVLTHRAAGRAVVLDRYYLTTCVYGQVLRAERHPVALLEQLGEQLIPAHVTVYLFAASEERHKRMQSRGHIGDEDRRSFDAELAAELDAAYLRMSTHRLVGRWLPIETSVLQPDEVVARILAALSGGAA